MKIFPMGTELFDAHGQTDVTKLMVAFRQFCERGWNGNFRPGP